MTSLLLTHFPERVTPCFRIPTPSFCFVLSFFCGLHINDERILLSIVRSDINTPAVTHVTNPIFQIERLASALDFEKQPVPCSFTPTNRIITYCVLMCVDVRSRGFSVHSVVGGSVCVSCLRGNFLAAYTNQLTQWKHFMSR